MSNNPSTAPARYENDVRHVRYISLASVQWAVRQNAVLVRNNAKVRITAVSMTVPMSAKACDSVPSLWVPGVLDGLGARRIAQWALDRGSLREGCFLHDGDFYSKSPIFSCMDTLQAWMDTHGWRPQMNDPMYVIR